MKEFKMNSDLECPIDISSDGKSAHSVIVEFLHSNGIADTGGCKAFYSPDEWQMRGEQYGLESHLIVVHDGGDHAVAFNWDYEDYESIDKMQQALSQIGMFAEQCTSWYSAIYNR